MPPPSNLQLINDQKKINKLHNIDDQLYYFDIWMYNQIEGQDPFEVPYIIIDSISIEESLSNWNTKGWIVINNYYEILEKYFPDTTKAPMIFRTDGRNRLRVNFYPVFEVGEKTTIENFGSAPKESFEVSKEIREKWEICLDCVIYDVEDIETPNSAEKKRKFYFQDERYQLFSEKNMEWSTAVEGRKLEHPNDPILVNPKDVDRTCRANYALKSIIKKSGENPNNTHIKVGIETIDYKAQVDYKAQEIDFSIAIGEWDDGTDDNKIFYTSPAYSTVNDDIKYVLDYCGTKERGPCFLDLTRWNIGTGKVFELRSLKSYFDDVKKNEQVEHLIIEDGIIEEGKIDAADGGGQKPYVPKAPVTESNQVKNFISGRASIIKAYRFSPMVSSDDSRICTTPLHQFDFSTGTFNIQFKDNKIDDVYDNMTNYVKDNLYSFTNSDAHFLLNINKTKKTGVMLHNHFEPLQFIPKFLPQTNMIRDSLFLNECICFMVAGLTIRSPGRFIFIDKLSSNADPSPHDDRFLGQWLIIKVVHLFIQGQYISEVTATKVDTFRKLWDKEDVK